MGWWEIDGPESPGIDASKAQGRGGLLNAVPGQDPRNRLYLGDDPADALAAGIDRIRCHLARGGRTDVPASAIADMLREARSGASPNQTLAQGAALKAVRAVDDSYVDAWQRKAAPEEFEALVRFVLMLP